MKTCVLLCIYNGIFYEYYKSVKFSSWFSIFEIYCQKADRSAAWTLFKVVVKKSFYTKNV